MMTKQTIAVEHIHIKSAKSIADVRARVICFSARGFSVPGTLAKISLSRCVTNLPAGDCGCLSSAKPT
jgi:hypothetical protein